MIVDCPARPRRQLLDFPGIQPDQNVRVQIDIHFSSDHSLDQSMPMMSSTSPTKAFRRFSLVNLETGCSATIFKTVPLRITSTGRPVSITSSRIRYTFSRSFEAVTRIFPSLRDYRTYGLTIPH